MNKKKLVFMVSGSGTNMENLVKEIRAGRLEAEAVGVISDRPGAGALEKARKLNVPVHIVDRKAHPDKVSFENAIVKIIDECRADYVVLAGFMRLLSDDFVLRYWGKIINIHPSLLPAFPGAHGIRDAFEAKAVETGVTVHFVDTGVDTGQVILQRKVPVHPEDSLESLETRIHAAEYEVYPEALRKVLSGRVPAPALPPGQSGGFSL